MLGVHQIAIGGLKMKQKHTQKIINQPSGRDYAPDVITDTSESSCELRFQLGMPVISIKKDTFDLNFFFICSRTPWLIHTIPMIIFETILKLFCSFRLVYLCVCICVCFLYETDCIFS